jgi:hypothetical protein
MASAPLLAVLLASLAQPARAAALPLPLGAQPFAQGNVVLLRYGPHASAAGAAGALPVYLDEVAPGGALVQTLALPATGAAAAAAAAGQNALTGGTSSSQGGLLRSENGQFLSFTGWATDEDDTAAPGTADGFAIGVCAADGSCDTSTASPAAADGGIGGSNARFSATLDGATFWTASTNGFSFERRPTASANAAAGCSLASRAGCSTLVVEPSAAGFVNVRGLNVFGGELYASSQSPSGLFTFYNSTPGSSLVASSQSAAITPLFAAPGGILAHSFAFVDTDNVIVGDPSRLLLLRNVGGEWKEVATMGPATNLPAVQHFAFDACTSTLYFAQAPSGAAAEVWRQTITLTPSSADVGAPALVYTLGSSLALLRGMAMAPGTPCAPAAAAPPAPPAPSPSPSPQPSTSPTAVSLTANVTAYVEGEVTLVSVSVGSPSALDFVAVFAGGAAADSGSSAPQRLVVLGAEYAATGKAGVRLRLLATSGGVRIALMRGSALDADGKPFPASWQAGGVSGCVELPNALVLLPATPNAPQRLRITPGDAPGDLRVSWTQAAPAQRPVVAWGASRDSQPSMATASLRNVSRGALCSDGPKRSIAVAEGWTDMLTYNYEALLSSVGLPGGGDVFYRVGDADAGLWSPVVRARAPIALATRDGRPAGAQAQAFFVVGDTGVGTADDSESIASRGFVTRTGVPRMLADAGAAGAPAFVGLGVAGDLTYADGYMSAIADFTDSLSPVTSSLLFLFAAGNHEAAWSGLNGDIWPSRSNSGGECLVPFSQLYPMPGGVTTRSPWFWFAQGAVAWVVFSTEHNFTTGSPQWQWLADTLPRINRALTPWLVVMSHRPTLVASGQSGADSHSLVASMLRKHVLPLLLDADASFMFAGHAHNYQRHCASDGDVSSPTCAMRGRDEMVTRLGGAAWAGAPVMASVYTNPKGPILLMCGNGGVPMDVETDAFSLPGADTLEVHRAVHGYGRLVMAPDGTAADFEMVAYVDGSVLDRVRVTQDPDSIAARQAARTSPQPWTAEEMNSGLVGRTDRAVRPSPSPTASAVPAVSASSRPAATASAAPTANASSGPTTLASSAPTSLASGAPAAKRNEEANATPDFERAIGGVLGSMAMCACAAYILHPRRAATKRIVKSRPVVEVVEV